MPTPLPTTIAEEPDSADDWVSPEITEEIREAHPTKSFLAHAFVYGLGGLIVQAASIVLLPLYTHHLEPSDYGLLEILNRVGEVLTICLMAGGIRLAALTFYNQAKSDAERDKTVTSVTLMVVLLLIAGGIATIAFPSYIGAAIGIEDTRLVVFGMFAMLLDITIAVPMTLMQARTESLLYSCVSFAMFLFRVIAIIIAVVVFHWGIWGILGATALTSLFFGVVLTWRELARGSIRLDWSRLFAIFRFAAPFIPTGLFFFAFRSADRFLLQKYAGLEAVGIYALGYRIASIVGAFTIAPLHQVWSARMFAAFELPNAASYFGRVFTRMLAAYTLAGMGFVIFADEVIRLLSTDKYFDAAPVVAPMVLAFFFLNAANLMDAAFYVRHRTSLKPWITGSATAVAIGLYLWLVPDYGEMGAAYANLAAFAFLAAATWAISQSVFRVKYERLRLAGMMLSALAIVFLSQVIPWGAWTIPVKLLLWASWPALLWLTGLVSRDEKDMLILGFWTTIAEGRKFYHRIVA